GAGRSDRRACGDFGPFKLIQGFGRILGLDRQDDMGRFLGELMARSHRTPAGRFGQRLTTLRAWVPDTVELVRAMPNTPALIGQGVTGILAPSSHHLEQARILFEACGAVVVLDKEELFDALTALSGSGPAYIFVAIEALADGGVRMGLPRATALELATRTVLGAAALVTETGRHPAQLKDDVASPGGTTIAGLAALEHNGFRSALIEAVTAATTRGQQLGAQAAQHEQKQQEQHPTHPTEH
ncbi:MAG: pyrroline-5-carboxylate reductase, partial [Myxococcota bacterium]